VTVDVNVTNAPPFNGYEFSLFFDRSLLSLYSINFQSGTMFNQPLVATNDNTTWGMIRESVVNLGGATPSDNGTRYGSGILLQFVFSVSKLGAGPLVLAAGISEPAEGHGATENDWTRLTLGNNFIDVSTSNGYFQNNPPRLGPVAKFTFSPSRPIAGDSVFFNATSSFDPDNAASRITRYFWDFGDGVQSQSASPTQFSIFAPHTGTPFFGNFSVLLIVFDSDDNSTGMVTKLVSVGRPPLHDLGVSLSLDRTTVSPGYNLTVTTTIDNDGTFDEVYNLSIVYGPPNATLTTYANQKVSPLYLHNTQSFKDTLHTKGLSPGAYEVVAKLKDPNDTIASNDVAIATFRIDVPQSSPLPYILGGAVGVAAALVVVRLVMQRRRVPLDE
jgi:hypothetical protein